MKLLKKLIIQKPINRTNREKLTKFVILKNFYLICVTIVFSYTATVGTNTIQSSVNKEEGLGLVSTAIYYASSTLSVLFIPQILKYFISFKWTYILGLFLQLPFVGLKAFPNWPCFIIASIIGGLGSALIFYSTAFGISELSKIYDEFIEPPKQKHKSSQSFFFGIFGAFIQIGDFLGNLMNALILKHVKIIDRKLSFDYSVCGKNFCPSYRLPTQAVAQEKSVYILTGVFCAYAILSVLVGLFMTNIDFTNGEKSHIGFKALS